MPSEARIIHVVAAVIERGERILIGQRKQGGRHALKWEFPGGKVEEGEEPPTALARELREELGIEATIGVEIARYDYQYAPERLTRLVFFHVAEFIGEPMNLEFAGIAWVLRQDLPAYDFLEGDVEFVQRLAQR
jgi:8-oxo-dGTP diphosphatase